MARLKNWTSVITPSQMMDLAASATTSRCVSVCVRVCVWWFGDSGFFLFFLVLSLLVCYTCFFVCVSVCVCGKLEVPNMAMR